MIKTKPDNTVYPVSGRVSLHPDWQGMTIRQRFAMAAMQGLLAADVDYDYAYDAVARDAVRHADALINALNRGDGASPSEDST